jgi:hypothetical protein
MNVNLEHLINNSNEIILSEFNITLISSKFKIYEQNDWDDFVNINNIPKTALGVYFPRNLTANLNSNSEYLPVTFLHEYFGHGLFCEYSFVGKKIVSLEKDLEKIEKKILNVNHIPENKHFKIASNNVFFNEYQEKQDELKICLTQNAGNYEGFAIWFEYFLSNIIGFGNLFQKKMETNIGKRYYALFEEFKLYVDNYGIKSLLHEMNFSGYD